MLINLIFAFIAAAALVAFGITLNHLRTERSLSNLLFDANFKLNERNLGLMTKVRNLKALAFKQRLAYRRVNENLERERRETLGLLEMVLDEDVKVFDRPPLSRDKFRRDFASG